MTSALTVKNTFLAVLFLGLLAMTARNVTDPDVWWHLKTGELIAEHRTVPRTDPFSFTRAGQPWVAHEWLTELGMYELQRIAGFGALIVIFAGFLTTAFFLLYLRCGPSPYVAGVATLCAAWATAPIWGVRPQVVSLLLTSLWLLLLERSERTPHLLWWTLPLTLLWVNLHAGFALGLVLSALFLATGLVESRLKLAPGNSHIRTSTAVLVCDLLLVPLNPNGLRMFSYPIETLRSVAMQNYIAEWASPNFHRPEYWPLMFIVLGTFLALACSGTQTRARDLILLSVGLFAGLASIRMIPLFVLIAIPLIARRLANWPRSPRPSRHSSIRLAVNSAIVLAMLLFATVRIASVIRNQPQAEAREFPSRAVAFLQRLPPKGAIFNHYDWGGYLIWKLYPYSPVFIDGRADLYGESLLHEFADAYQLRSSWQQSLERWHIQTVIVPPDSALATGLRNSPAWTISYQDAQAIILTRIPVGAAGLDRPGQAKLDCF